MSDGLLEIYIYIYKVVTIIIISLLLKFYTIVGKLFSRGEKRGGGGLKLGYKKDKGSLL